MAKALVTGGAGFIGSNIVKLLLENDFEPVVLDSLYLGNKDNLPDDSRVEFIEGSVMNREKVREAIEGCDIVYHQAARSSSPMHKDDPIKGAKVNIEGFMNVVEEAKQSTVEKIVYASTSSMYGTIQPPHKEHTGEEPNNLYTASKMSREMYAKAYAKQTDIHFTGLRYFSVYGPRESSKGEYANVLTQFMWKMMDGERPEIWGMGTRSRDFTYVRDIARANILASKITQRTNGEVFNIGTGVNTSFNQLVELLNQELGTDIKPKHVPHPRDNPVKTTKADYSKAEEKLGYTPKYSLEEGIKLTKEYYQS